MMRIDARWVGGGIAAAVAGFAGAWYLKEALTEKPGARVLLTDGNRQLRAYPRLLVAQVVKPGARERALDDGYDALSDYITGKRRDGPRIGMTAPVLSERHGEGWRTRFVMPRRFTRADLPAPVNEVEIAEEPARRVAAIGFAGRPDDAKLAEQEAELRRWIATKGLRIDGDAVHAFYNSPFIPSVARRTEVLIPVG